MMLQQCPHCGHAIRSGAKFCPGCGRPVASILSGAGQALQNSQTRDVVRIMSFGEILGSSVRLFVRYFFRLFLASLVGYAIWALLTILIGVVLVLPLLLVENATPILYVLAVLLIGLPIAIINAPLTLAVSSLVVADRLSYSGLVASVFSRRLLYLLLTVALQSLLVFLGSLLIVPGIYLTVVFSMTPAAVMLEDRVGWAALQRSHDLVRGYWWKTFGLLLTSLLLPMGIFLLIAAAVIQSAATSDVGQLIFIAVLLLATIALPCFSAVVQILLYYDLRSRRGNFSAKSLMTVPTVRLLYERI